MDKVRNLENEMNIFSILNEYEANSMDMGLNSEHKAAWPDMLKLSTEGLVKTIDKILREDMEHAHASVNDLDYIPPDYYGKGCYNEDKLVHDILDIGLRSNRANHLWSNHWINADSTHSELNSNTRRVNHNGSIVETHMKNYNSVAIKIGLLLDTPVYSDFCGDLHLFLPNNLRMQCHRLFRNTSNFTK